MTRPLRWLTVALGLLCTATGALLTLSPFASLAALAVLVATGLILTGLVELARSGAAPDTPLSVVTGLGWLAAGVAVAAWPGPTIRVLAVPVGLVLIAVSYVCYRAMPSDLLPGLDEGGFILDYLSPAGSSLAETDRMLQHVDNLLRSR